MRRLGVFLLGAAFWLGPLVAQSTRLTDEAVVSFRVRFGVTDTAERAWDGTATVSSGELIGLRDWHPRPGNEITGRNSWRLSTRKGLNFRWRPWEHAPDSVVQEYYWTPGVILDIETSAGTRVNMRTTQGRFSFNPRDVASGKAGAFLNGAVLVDRVPSAEKLSGADHQDDFVSMLGGENGEVWVCWVAYRDNANEVLARRFDGREWSETRTITEKPGDIFLAKMGRDRKGRPWVVWSDHAGGDFDLYGRVLDPAGWGPVMQLTNAPGPDVFHNLAADAEGNLWLVWQSSRAGRSDIYARRFDGERWSEEFRVSVSEASDWEPVLAADSRGAVTIAWDSYDKGDYDVLMRTFSDGRWGDAEPIAATRIYEAHVALAYDGEDRLWAAWNESGMNWGKDTGFTLNTEGTRLYEYRTLNLAVRDGAAWKSPAADINSSLPENLREYNDFPQLARDAKGRIWLFARHRTLRQRDLQSEAPAHRACWEIWGATLDGDEWSEPIHVPFSYSRMDVRWGVASDGRGSLWAAWPTDNRDFQDFLFQHADVYAARLPELEAETRAPKLVPRLEGKLYFHDMAPTEKKDLERIRAYEIRSGGKTYRIYRGDTHRHTEFSMDGNNDGSLFQTYRYAIDVAELDYLLDSEHNSAQGPDVDYINWLLQQTVDVFSVDGRFQPFYGYERSLTFPDGHRNILFAKRGNPTLPITPDERRHEVGAKPLYAYLKKYGGIAISHTSATGMGTDWRDNDPEVEPLVEIYQGDRVSAEYEGAPRAAHKDNLSSAPGNFRPAGYVWNAWAKGYKLGVQAASDHLSTHISYACTIAEEFTREGMLEAMKKRHSYGATDNIILDYRLEAGGKEYLQGDIVTVDGDFKLSVKVIGTTPIRQIDIIRNQEFLHNRQNLPQETSFTFVDNEPLAGENFYYVRVIQNDGNMAWSSPIWVTRR